MSNTKKRIENIERKLAINQRVENLIIKHLYVESGGTATTFPEPDEEWLTYEEQLHNEPFGSQRIIQLCPNKEQQARIKTKGHNLQVEFVKIDIRNKNKQNETDEG